MLYARACVSVCEMIIILPVIFIVRFICWLSDKKKGKKVIIWKEYRKKNARILPDSLLLNFDSPVAMFSYIYDPPDAYPLWCVQNKYEKYYKWF